MEPDPTNRPSTLTVPTLWPAPRARFPYLSSATPSRGWFKSSTALSSGSFLRGSTIGLRELALPAVLPIANIAIGLQLPTLRPQPSRHLFEMPPVDSGSRGLMAVGVRAPLRTNSLRPTAALSAGRFLVPRSMFVPCWALNSVGQPGGARLVRDGSPRVLYLTFVLRGHHKGRTRVALFSIRCQESGRSRASLS